MTINTTEKKGERTTAVWQNAGLSAKLNFSPFYPPKAVCFCFFIKFTKRLTALATFGSELNFRSIQARTSPSPRAVRRHTKSQPHKQHFWFLPAHEPTLKKTKNPFFVNARTNEPTIKSKFDD